jgi:hypothetical protein
MEQTNFPKFAVQHDIPLIMYGENGEVEYGGDMKNAFIRLEIIREIIKNIFFRFGTRRFN